MTVTLYSQNCTPCTNKLLWSRMKKKAAEKRLLLMRKDVRKDIQAKQDANEKYGMSVPFVVVDEKAMTVEEFLND